MTHAEIIATKLFGWTSIEAPPGRDPKLAWYSSPDGKWRAYVDAEGYGRTPRNDWPNFDSPQLKYYWVAQMEAKLAERGLAGSYIDKLAELFILSKLYKPMVNRIHNGPSVYRDYGTLIGIGLYATPEQRIEAATKVLEGVE